MNQIYLSKNANPTFTFQYLVCVTAASLEIMPKFNYCNCTKNQLTL